ncbi:cytochrome p450 [Moniliophthora roreri MCA 2997]|uniref:Cytochrome p450 n=2 Tax=Moniliophthora roreri TaxID=221103 RepID=V2WZ36_MONRO|nr:cytochrome p450 [Moniliophthora roreri MCA 2997]KAI3605454.1 cytochrome p450 [Moniliophthora roreri]
MKTIFREQQNLPYPNPTVSELLTGVSEGELTMTDYDELAGGWLGVCVKEEALRLHPADPYFVRTATHTNIINLELPVLSSSGISLSEVLIHPGQRIIIDISVFNRLESVWGADLNRWNPSRSLTSDHSSIIVGMTSNLLTFTVQKAASDSILVSIQFDPLEDVEIKEGMGFPLLVPMAIGKDDAGSMLPLLVRSERVDN